MKNNQMTFALVGVLFLSTLITVVLLYYYNRSIRTLAEVHPKMLQAQAAVPRLVNSMFGDIAEYSKKNPAIDPFLKKYNIVPNAQPAGR